MREHGALRDAGRPAGVLKQREVVRLRARIEGLGRRGEQFGERNRARIARERLSMTVLLLFRECEEKTQDRRHLLFDVRNDHMLDCGPGASGLHEWVEARKDHDHLRPRVGELMLQLRRRVPRIARNDDSASPKGAVERDDELRRVREDERDAVTLLDT